MTCYVYFIRQERRGPIKIGRSTNPQRRLACLQAANPDELKLEVAVEGSGHMERALHLALCLSRLRGEWFRPTRGVLAALEAAREGRLQEHLQPILPPTTYARIKFPPITRKANP